MTKSLLPCYNLLHETHLSAQKNQAPQHSRFPYSHGVSQGPSRYLSPPRHGPSQVNSIMSPMISKSNKFPTRIQLLSFRKIAKQSTTPHTRVYYLESSVSSRLSVIVPIKVSKRATTRNSFKRLVYDIVWKLIKDKNLDCIVIFKPIALLKGKISQDLIIHELSQLTGLL